MTPAIVLSILMQAGSGMSYDEHKMYFDTYFVQTGRISIKNNVEVWTKPLTAGNVKSKAIILTIDL